MRAVVQRVSEAAVRVDGVVIGKIGAGLMVLLGVTHDDTEPQAVKIADKLAKLRIFSDSDDKMNLSVKDIEGRILLISQFTLYGDARKGNRPSFIDAASPDIARTLIETVKSRLETEHTLEVQTGEFGADMKVSLLNDGPVTLIVET